MAERYVKLNLTWGDSEWLSLLSDGARLAWVFVLVHVKATGIGGRAKSISSEMFARKFYLNVKDVDQLLIAAQKDGALVVEDGEWIITKWKKHQGDETNAKRQKDWRERHREEQFEPESTAKNTVRNGHNALRNARNTEEKRREDNKPPKSPKGDVGCLSDFFDGDPQVKAVFAEYQAYRRERKSSPYKGIGLSNLATQLRNNGYTPSMVVELLKHCMASNWLGVPSGYIEKLANSKRGSFSQPVESEAFKRAYRQWNNERILAEGRGEAFNKPQPRKEDFAA